MKIKNLFIAIVITLFIGNTVFAQSAGIPLSEYNLLKEFYGNTYGPGWANNINWLDTTNHSVADWFGITVENNHVTKIELSNNNLQEAIFGTRFLLPELTILDLSGNLIDNANFGNLDSLSNLEVLKIENNKFIFKHIRDVSFLPNYNNFSDNFTYSPQAKIDVDEEISINKGDLIEMYVSSRYLSANDQFQWYKDNVALVGETSASFDKTNAVAEDAGTYYLKITNPDVSGLTLQSFDKVVTVTDLVAGIPYSEFNALERIYYSTNGGNWNNNTNWLDTANYLVADWYGVTVEGGHVIKIELSNNNLQEAIFGTRFLLPELKILDLSGNLIDNANFGNLDSLSNLEALKIENNKFIFKHIRDVSFLPNYNNFSDNFTYSPQAIIDVAEEITVEIGSVIEMSVFSLYLSANDQFQWYKDDAALTGETNVSFEKTNAIEEDSGTYYLKITNPDVSGLTLQSFDKVVTVTDLVAGVLRKEYEALVEFYNALDGDNWKNNENWLDTISHDINDWYGITVEGGHVTTLLLSNNNLVGIIPNIIGNLSALQKLHLWYNNINGNIPAEIGNLTNLTSLALNNNNNISGSIPKELGNLSKLVHLNLSGNNLSGSIPKELGNLSNLETLYLSLNRISGLMPPEIGNLSELKYFKINHNTIHGPLPDELSKLKKLVLLHINANWIGKIVDEDIPREARQIPNILEEMSSLKYLRIGQNYLLFNDIEPIFSWTNYNNLIEFKYELQTSLHKSIEIMADPDETVKITIPNYYPSVSDTYQWMMDGDPIAGANDSTLVLTNVQLENEGFYYCKISNNVATDLTLQVYSTTLKVNDVHGAGVSLAEYNALVEFYNTTNGDNWRKKDNWLDTINCTVAEWEGIGVINKHVYEISMDTNNVSGSFPISFYDLHYLERIFFYMNELSGSLPDDIDKLTKLRVLYLSDNNLSGSVPESIGKLNNLYHLNLDNNNLEGNIPDSLGNLINLIQLSLQNNSLTGVIPSSLGNLTNLSVLNLSNNQLIGPVPAELKNLTKVYRIELDNNLIGGSNSGEKSANILNSKAENNRQIPDELADLISMDTFRLGNNSLQFNDIEAIFSWDNFSDFKDFIYHPQGLIGTEKIIEKTENESVTLSIENQYPGNSDNYKWYKNGALLANSNSKTLTISNLKTSHSGKYHCMVTNSVATELSLTSKEITLTVNEADNNYNVPVSEYNALKAFYDGLGGNYWMNKTNWLDTVNATVNDWHGVTVNDGHITKIELYSNRLSGELPDELTELDSLTVLNLNNNYIKGMLNNWIGELSSLKELNLSENELYGLINFQLSNIEGLESLKLSKNKFSGEIPDWLENLDNLSQFHIENNNFTSRFLEPVFNWNNYNNFKYEFEYSPQANVGEEKTLSVILGDTLTIEIKDYVPGEADIFQWYKDNVSLVSETQSKIEIMQVANADSGIYYCKITNTIATDLVINSDLVTVKISGKAAGAGVPLSEYLALVEIYDSTNGNAWTNNLNWFDTISVTVNDWFGVTVENGHVSRFEMPNNNLSKIPIKLKDLPELKKADFSSGNFSGEIPNLGNLASLDEFSLANNNFVFNDLIPIADWVNYNNFKINFNYSPQTGVGETESLTVYLGDTINLEVKNYISDNSDNFEWFRNGISIQNSEKYNLEKEAWLDDNNAVFLCEITNSLLPDLTLNSEDINVTVNYSSNDSLALINLRNEYEILQEIWTNNSIFTWSNITFENGFVTAIDLYGLNLEGIISPIFTQFDSLVSLNLSNNNLSGEIPPFSNTKNGNIKSISSNEILTYLNIANNNFRFIDLETNASDFSNIDVFIYAPQQSIGQPIDTSIYKYEGITFEIGNYIPGSSDIYAWFKDGQEVTGKNDLTFTIENAALQDSGYYTCSITNTLFADLTLHSDTCWLKVMVPVGIDDQNLSEFNVYPNPAQNRIYIDTKNESINLKVFNLTGNLVLEKNNTKSGWIDIKQFTSGVYVFRAIRKNSEIINIKVIFK